MEKEAIALLKSEHIPEESVHKIYSLDMRYVKQYHEVNVELTKEELEKRDIELIIGLFTAITSFSKEAIERQLKGLSVEGMEIKMFPFENSDLALLFILSKEPSPILIKRMNQFIIELEREFGELFITMDHLDFTNDIDVKKKIYNIMVKTLKFDLKKLLEMNENKE